MKEDDLQDIGWCILELMGRRRLGGYVQETELAGGKFLRIDVPGMEKTLATQYYSPAAIYCITPTDEETARACAQLSKPQPISRWELPQPQPERHPINELQRGFEDDDF